MNKRISLLALLAVCWLLPPSALAWGPRGHRLVGLIAEKRLSATAPQALSFARKLLRTTNAPNTNCEATAAARSFADVANLPDDFRQIELALVTRDWHFVNIDIANPTYDEGRDCPTGDCVVRRIERMRELLKDRSRAACDRESALIYLVHFVGDVHQPFHTGFGHLPNGDPDLGGNRVTVTIDGQQRKLHGVWDSSLIERQNRSDQQWVKHLMTDVLGDRDPETLASGEVIDWTNESHEMAIERHVEDGTTLDNVYIKESTMDVDERLLVAGLRLARVIEEALK
ncbi:MAG: S1/P1 nuclease [Acidobacteriota bacterium]